VVRTQCYQSVQHVAFAVQMLTLLKVATRLQSVLEDPVQTRCSQLAAPVQLDVQGSSRWQGTRMQHCAKQHTDAVPGFGRSGLAVCRPSAAIFAAPVAF
jgi:hypothetical protein